uniref:Uncharacterized protein n=1 Tax=Oryza glumipatula TaxID=40148 RepID=A0A0D9Y251_9ORYZ
MASTTKRLMTTARARRFSTSTSTSPPATVVLYDHHGPPDKVLMVADLPLAEIGDCDMCVRMLAAPSTPPTSTASRVSTPFALPFPSSLQATRGSARSTPSAPPSLPRSSPSAAGSSLPRLLVHLADLHHQPSHHLAHGPLRCASLICRQRRHGGHAGVRDGADAEEVQPAGGGHGGAAKLISEALEMGINTRGDKKATTPSWPEAPAPFPRAPKEFCRSLHPEFLGLQVEFAELGLGAPEMVLWAPERASQSLRLPS